MTIKYEIWFGNQKDIDTSTAGVCHAYSYDDAFGVFRALCRSYLRVVMYRITEHEHEIYSAYDNT